MSFKPLADYSVMELLSHALRGAIVAAPGKQLFVADYSAIEARVLLWLADDEDALGIFERGEDIYLTMAAEIYGRVCTKADVAERQLSKIAVLALGYGMGASKFVDTCASFKIMIEDDWAQGVVDTYRSKFWRVKALWQAQQDSAIWAVQNSGRSIYAERIEWLNTGDFLYCTLPSGRRLAYPFPEVHEKMTPWGESRPSLTFMGIDTYTRKWKRQQTYGGSLVENQVQAIARDLLAEALLRCEHSGVYLPILSVHDESICEAPQGAGSLHEFDTLMTTLPEWAVGCPVAVESWRGTRYKK